MGNERREDENGHGSRINVDKCRAPFLNSTACIEASYSIAKFSGSFDKLRLVICRCTVWWHKMICFAAPKEPCLKCILRMDGDTVV